MQTKEDFPEISNKDITLLLKQNYNSLMSVFYETQSSFLSGIYKRYGNIETANILEFFNRNLHLEIIRQREKKLNYNVSLDKLRNNMQNIVMPSEKISAIVKITGIPKETVRRKVKNLLNKGFLINGGNAKSYSWSPSTKNKERYFELIENEALILSKLVYHFAKYLKLNVDINEITKEIKLQFSFYIYHFLNCQLQWLKMWQNKLKDNELLLIILQCIIPTLQFADKKKINPNVENIFKIIGVVNNKDNFSKTSVSAAAISEITGIPRATCVRKLGKLVILGFLLRETKTKRYYVNQNYADRTKNVTTKENVNDTIDTFSKFLTVALNNLTHVKK